MGYKNLLSKGKILIYNKEFLRWRQISKINFHSDTKVWVANRIWYPSSPYRKQ